MVRAAAFRRSALGLEKAIAIGLKSGDSDQEAGRRTRAFRSLKGSLSGQRGVSAALSRHDQPFRPASTTATASISIMASGV